jgi:hypothetical protein
MHSLAIIQILSGSLSSVLNNEKDINKILEDARNMKKFVPNSFLSSDLIPKEGFNEKRKNINL